MSTGTTADHRTWLRRLRAVSTFVFVSALGLAAAFLMLGPLARPLWSFDLNLAFAATTVPGLAVIAEIARRMRRLLKAAEHDDPFTAHTALELTFLAKLTGFGGLVAWLANEVAAWALYSARGDGAALTSAGTLLAWLGVAMIFAAFAQLVRRGVDMRAELESVI